MKYLLSTFLLAFCFVASYASGKNDEGENIYRYEIESFEGQVAATEEYVIVKVWTYGKKEDAQRKDIAMRNAIHGLLFKGYAASSNRAGDRGKKALVPAGYDSNKEYFDNFFTTDYMQYVELTNNGQMMAGDILKISKKEYKIGRVVKVNYGALRTRLEKDNIIKSLDSAFKNAKKPTIMVIPSDTWCKEYGYVKTFNNQGETVTVPDYEKAFLSNGELKMAITSIGNLMQSRGFPLKDMEQEIKNIAQSRAEDMVRSSESGAEIDKSPLDELLEHAKCDIIIDLYWKVNKLGMERSLSYNLKGLDAYTSKQIAGTNGTGEPSTTAELAILVEEAVNGSIDKFNDKLMTHFQDIEKNGREIKVDIKVWDDSPYKLEDDVDGEMLCDIIDDWFAENTVNSSYSTATQTDTRIEYEQVRIPLVNEKGRKIDARYWCRSLSKKLKDLGVDNKITMKGLGQAGIIIGGK